MVLGSLILSWQNITASTGNADKSNGRRLLSEVSGIARSGVLTAILSPSGAGKTTLLAVLSKRFKGHVIGEVLVNGYKLDEGEMALISGYVCQRNQNYQDLTVYEHLIFMARLKMDKNLTPESYHQNVLRVTKNLILAHKLHTTISSLSGGQKKRLSLAVQLLTEPKILFCDEPTTGLDSYSAEQVLKLLKAIANDGRMVICSIHQPASGSFELFDDVTLLASGGKLAFHGPVSSICSFLSGCGASCPKNFNLSEFIVSQVTNKNSLNGQMEDEHLKIQRVVDCFTQSEAFENLMMDISGVSKEKTALPLPINILKRETVSFETQFNWLFWRTALLSKHSIKRTLVNFSVNGIICFYIGLLYHGSFGKNQKEIQSTLGFMYAITMQLSHAALFFVLNELPDEIPTCVLEIADHVYSPLPFYLSRSLYLTCITVIQNIIFMLLCFWASGLPETMADYSLIILITVFMTTVSCAFGLFLSTAFRSTETNTLFAIPFEFINSIFCGFSLRINSLPWFLRILKYTSYQYFIFEALNIIEWSKFDHNTDCNATSKIPCYKSGDEILSLMGFERDHLPMDIIGLILSTLGWHLLAFGFLLHKLKLFATY